IEVAETDRGGRVTYHGPGQLVGYPIVSLKPYGDDVHEYIRRMERVIVAALADWNVDAGLIDGLTGVWAMERKIGSIGVHVNRGVTTHGFAINVNNDLQPFEWIVPCGIEARPFRERKPPWLKVPAPGGPTYRRLKQAIHADNLHTVCEEANCPNVGECWERGTATFMILGDVCTRRCGFCNVQTGKPTWSDPLEPLRVANQVKAMGLRHAVVTSVDRDDLPDYGASAFVGVIRSIRMLAPDCAVEVLTPDFRGQEMPLAKVIHEKPDVFNHNVETVPRLYPKARRGSEFMRSARVLRLAKEMGSDEVVTKSGLMVGLGETFDEMVEAFGILRDHR